MRGKEFLEVPYSISVVFSEVNMQSDTSLWNFTVLAPIRKGIDLVRHNVTGQLMVRRISPAADFPVLCAVSLVRHPNLMAVYDVREQDGVCLSLCEFINGTTLAEQVQRSGVFDIKTAKNILCQICDGLTALHQSGIVHRDIKPANVMTDNGGNVKIIDYSISRQMKLSKNQDTVIMGTAGYASPEQFGFAQTGGRADIYACGVLLNYLLTGHLPNEMMHQGALKTVIERCIEIDENKRFATAEDLKKVLQGKRINRRRNFRPLPGFRSGNPAAKFFTVLFFILWFFMLLVYINGFPAMWNISWENNLRQVVLCADIMVLWSALPYFLFGDIFRMSEKINPDNPQNGRYVLRILGIAGIILGFVLIFITVKIT